jgi:hypothetical protein
MTGDDASAARGALPDGLALVVASSMDVYRAFSSLWKGTVTDPVPWTEESAVRAEPPPDRALVMRRLPPSRRTGAAFGRGRGAQRSQLAVVSMPSRLRLRFAGVQFRKRVGRRFGINARTR